MAILVNKNSKIVVQGITGKEGLYHAEHCHAYAGNVVAGVTPGKGGQTVLESKIPVYDSCLEAANQAGANVSLIFVPPPFAADAIIEAALAGIAVIVCITEGIPVHDMIMVKHFLAKTNSRLIGPNCPGLLTPEGAKVGIMPGFIAKKGRVGVISKSGTLTYEAVNQLCLVGLGQSTCIGIGGDPIIGSSMKDLLQLFKDDDETDAVVLIGEIGGDMEIEAARYVKTGGFNKPVIGFIAGRTAPPGRRMGHAGAIVSGADESASAKIAILKECGIHVSESPATIGETVKNILK